MDTSLTLREKNATEASSNTFAKSWPWKEIPQIWESILVFFSLAESAFFRFKLSIVLHSASVEKISGPGLVQVGVGVAGLKYNLLSKLWRNGVLEEYSNLGCGNSNVFYVHPVFGEMIQFG